jgi:hypothetical protein
LNAPFHPSPSFFPAQATTADPALCIETLATIAKEGGVDFNAERDLSKSLFAAAAAAAKVEQAAPPAPAQAAGQAAAAPATAPAPAPASASARPDTSAAARPDTSAAARPDTVSVDLGGELGTVQSTIGGPPLIIRNADGSTTTVRVVPLGGAGAGAGGGAGAQAPQPQPQPQPPPAAGGAPLP